MICCKVTGLTILIIADKLKENTGKTFERNKEMKKQEFVQIDLPESQQESFVFQLQAKNVSTVQSSCTKKYSVCCCLLSYSILVSAQVSTAQLYFIERFPSAGPVLIDTHAPAPTVISSTLLSRRLERVQREEVAGLLV